MKKNHNFLYTVHVVFIALLALLLSSCGSDSSDSSNSSNSSSPLTTQATPSLGYWQGAASRGITSTQTDAVSGMFFQSNGKYYLALVVVNSTVKSSLSEISINGLEAKSSQCSSQSADMTSCEVKGVFDGADGKLTATYSYTLKNSSKEFISLSVEGQKATENKMALPNQELVFIDSVNESTIRVTKGSAFQLTSAINLAGSTSDITITEQFLRVSKPSQGDFWGSSVEHLSDDVSKMFAISISNNSDLSKHGNDAGWHYSVATNTVVTAYNKGKESYEKFLQAKIIGDDDFVERKCSSCHGINGQGGGSIPALRGNPNVLTNTAIDRILNGSPGRMASFSTNTNKVIAELVTYIRHAWGNSPLTSGNYVTTEAEVQNRRPRD